MATEDGYELEMDLPGFKKEEVSVELNNGYITIRAAKGLDEDEKEKKTGKYIRRERYSGACERSFYVGEEVTQEDIKGEYKHGILKLFVPKEEVTQQDIKASFSHGILKLDIPKKEAKKIEQNNFISIE